VNDRLTWLRHMADTMLQSRMGYLRGNLTRCSTPLLSMQHGDRRGQNFPQVCGPGLLNVFLPNGSIIGRIPCVPVECTII